MGWQFIHLQESRVPSQNMVTWGDKGHHILFLLLSPALYVELYVMGYPFGQSGSAIPAMSPPILLCTPTSSLVVWHEKQKRPLLCVIAAQQKLKHVLISNTACSTNPKHYPMLTTVKKIISIPAKTSKLVKRDTKSIWHTSSGLKILNLTYFKM